MHWGRLKGHRCLEVKIQSSPQIFVKVDHCYLVLGVACLHCSLKGLGIMEVEISVYLKNLTV